MDSSFLVDHDGNVSHVSTIIVERLIEKELASKIKILTEKAAIIVCVAS